MRGRAPTPGRIATAAAFALCIGVAFIAFAEGFSQDFLVRLAEGVAVLVVGGAALAAAMALAVGRMADWREPESEAEFDRVVERSERLARQGTAAEPDETDFLELDPLRDEHFEELVREALDELPDLLQEALRRNVGVVISDGGRRHGAYGLYRGDGVSRDNFPDQIIIFRDTLRRDFGHDPDELRDQVTRTVRHELAHHLGADELGVRELGL